MLRRDHIVLLSAISLLPSVFAAASGDCTRSCGSGGSSKLVPFPFGFSGSCEIKLNCGGDAGEILIGGFPVRTLTPDGLLVGVLAECHRPLHSLRRLYGRNFAPTSRNAILLQNCSAARLPPCELPRDLVQGNLKASDCDYSKNNNISCYTEEEEVGFMNFSSLSKSGCRSLYSSVFVQSSNDSAVSMEVQALRLEWWIEGRCNCSRNAKCTELVSPVTGDPGFRCRCVDGFEGDGFRAGRGCRKVSSACNASKYLSGQCGKPARVGALIGGFTFGACVIIGVALLCCFLRRRRSSFNAETKTKWLISEATTGCCSIPFYAYKELEKATNSFAEQQRLGTGAYGTVYLGKICNNELVAIKRIKRRDTDSIEQVVNEIKLLSSVRHPSLVRLLGCSLEKGEQVLVYEFMPNGTLLQHLQRERGDGLSWAVRLAIASETARAIAHLHSADPPVYHRDIKSSNILLDYEFRSKVADFGLSRLGKPEMSHISTAPQGTLGYLDPQYHQNFHLSDKSDVYSFGVVLAEIITGLKVVDFSRPPNEVNLAALAAERIREGRLDEIVDAFLERDPRTRSSVHKVAELAFRCLAFHQDARPSMLEAADELEQIRACTSAGESLVSFAEAEAFSISDKSDEPTAGGDPKGGSAERRGLFAVTTNEKCRARRTVTEDDSPVSVVQDPWLSEENSPSTSCLLNNLIQ